MSPKKTVFFNGWLSLPNYETWLQAVPYDKFSAGCKLCNSVFSLSNMGKQALTSHMKSKKHLSVIKNMKSCNTLKIFNNASNTSSESTNQPNQVNSDVMAPSSNNVNTASDIDLPKDVLKSFMLTEDVAKAEIIWCLHVATEHLTFRSAERTLSAFKIMCQDSQVLNKMQLQRTKLGYTIVHGLAPYFKRKLDSQLQRAHHIVVGFDESFNKISIKQQMDLVVRFWNPEKNEVKSSYLTSAFLGHTTAADIMKEFKMAVKDINLKKLIQISMDGPNVNFKFLNDLKKELKTSPSEPVLLDLGSCGLHTIHCAFKAALVSTQWDIVHYLRSLYNLFKDVPARRAEYLKYTGSTVFPKKFCPVRWGENVSVVRRAIEIHENVKKFIHAIENEKKPSFKSFQVVSSYIKDDLLLSKLAFFETLANIIEPFIIEFQKEAPLAPFLYETLKNLLQSVMVRFVKQDVMRNSSSITDVDVVSKSNMKNIKEVDVGYAVRAMLKKSKVHPAQIENFLKSCRMAFQKFIQKLIDRSPIKYQLTKGISCLNPEIVVLENLAIKRLSLCLQILVAHNWISGSEADKIDYQYKSLIQKPGVIELCKSFDRSCTRLDNFWMSIVDCNPGYFELRNFFQFVLILSHGNAAIERGFSINKDCLLYNQHEESLVALRLVHDTVTSAGGISSIEIDKSLIHAARYAHTYYKEALKNKEEKEKTDKNIEDERKNASIKVKELQLKKMKLLADTEKKALLIDEEMKLLKK